MVLPPVVNECLCGERGEGSREFLGNEQRDQDHTDYNHTEGHEHPVEESANGLEHALHDDLPVRDADAGRGIWSGRSHARVYMRSSGASKTT